MIYADSSALLKLLYEEAESEALRAWLRDRRGTAVLSSRLTVVEVVRACRRRGGSRTEAAQELLAGLDLVALSDDLLHRAAEVGDDLLRSLDAVHLATAELLRPDLDAVLVYDVRLRAASADLGLPTAAPT